MSITRYNPAAERHVENFAPPTMERGQHHLFHSKAGDIWGSYSGPATDPDAGLVGNILIIAQCDRRKAATALCEAVQQAGLKSAAVVPWLKATNGPKSMSMWAVVFKNATPEDLETARPFFPAAPVPKAAKSPAGAQKVADGKHVRLTRFHSGTRAARTAQHVSERVARMPAATFAFLLGTSDMDAAAAQRDAFAAHLRNGHADADWRREWSIWSTGVAPQTTADGAPCSPAATAALSALRNLKSLIK